MRDTPMRNPVYMAWAKMKSRCTNKADPSFHRYGGRGITVCERWALSFDAFLADMGDRPPGMSVDRIDVNGNYEPSNCRWATPIEQANNRRHNVYITMPDGRRLTAAQAAREAGIRQQAITSRLKRGVTDVNQLLSPQKKRGAYRPRHTRNPVS